MEQARIETRRVEKKREEEGERERSEERRWASKQRTVRFPESETQQTAVCRAKSMRAGDRELPLSYFFLPRGTLSSSTSTHTTANPLHSRVLLFRSSTSHSAFRCFPFANLRRTNATGRAHPLCNPLCPRSLSPLQDTTTPSIPEVNKLYFYHARATLTASATFAAISSRTCWTF